MPPRRNQRVNLPLKERIRDGRIFHTNKKTATGIVYMRCKTRFCAGTAKKMPNGDIVSQRAHSIICYKDRNAQSTADFIHALKSALERNFWKLKEVYETVVAMYPPEVKVLVPYNSIVSSLKRWRRRFYPPCPENLEEMAFQLELPENERLLAYDVGSLVSKRITDNDGNLHLLIYDPQFIRSEFSNVSRLFIDGTFQTAPRVRGVYQLVSVLGVRYDHALPFAHVLMANKTQSAYMAVLTEIKNILNNASITVVMTDFEQALRNACRDTFVDAHVTGCSVHYDRALLKKIKSLRLTPLIRENEVAKVFLKKLMALAYLPEQMIQAEFIRLKNALSTAMKRSLASFLRYYEHQWLRRVKPAGFSVFGLSRRTNNVIESYNSVLADKLGQHPRAWAFMAKLIQLTSNARDDVRSLRLNKRIRRHPRYATIYKQKELTNAWKQLHLREITPEEFLNKTATLKGHVSQRLTNIADEPSEDEAEVEETPDNVPFDDPDYDHHIFQDLHFVDFVHENGEATVKVHNHESDNDLIDMEENEEANGELDSSFLQENVVADESSEDESIPVAIESQLSNEDAEVDPDETLLIGINPADESDVADIIPVPENEVPAGAEQESNAKVSSSRKKNLRKKRRRLLKAQNGERQVRPYGHKRRQRGKNKREPKCVVCLENAVSHGFVPCGHNCCCLRCAEILAEQALKRCPKCRTDFTQFMAIFNE